MPWSALPPHIDSPEEWAGKDDDQHWFTAWRKRVKGFFAFGPRATEWWARWRFAPKAVFAVGGRGPWRFENDKWDAVRQTPYHCHARGWYLSRIQYWKPWHIQVQWPLFVAAHVYLPKVTLPEPKERYRDEGLVYFYVGAKRDGDAVYWFPAIFLGRGWK